MNRKVGIVLSLIYTAIEVLVTFLITPYIISTLGNSEFGVYKLCESVTTYLMLLDFGVGQAVVRYIAKYRANNDKKGVSEVVGLSIIIYAIIGIITIIVGSGLVVLSPILFGKGLNRSELSTMKYILIITTINAALILSTTSFSNTIVAFERFKFQKILLIVQLVFRGGLYYVFLNLGMGSVGMVAVQFVLTIVCRSLMAVYVRVYLRIQPVYHGIKKALIHEVVGFSGWIFLMMISTQVNRYLDQILLGALVSSSATLIAVYSTGLQLEYYFEHIGFAINNVLMPGVVRLVESNRSPENLCNEMVRIGRYVFTVLAFVWTVFAVCGKEFIALWVGKDYKEAYIVALLLMTVSMFIMTQGVGDNILSAMRELREWALLNVAVIIINFLISVTLIQWNPILGVLIGTFLSMLFCGIIIKNYLYVKKIHIDLVVYYRCLLRRLWLCILLTFFWGVMIKGFIMLDRWFTILLMFFLMGIVYAVLCWLIGFNKFEKQYICELFAGIRRKNNMSF